MLDCFFGVPTRALGEMEELVIDFGDAGTQVFHVGDGSVAVPGLLAGLEEVARALRDPRVGASSSSRRSRSHDAGFERDEQRATLHAILEGILAARRGRAAHLRRSGAGPHRGCVRDARARPRRGRGDGRRAPPRVRGRPPRVPRASRRRRSSSRRRRARRRSHAVAGRAASCGGSSSSFAAGGRAARSRTRLAPSRTRTAPLGSGPLPGTTHISVVDGDGLAAGLSSTLGSGSGVFRGGTQLNNMLGELDVIGTGEKAPGERLASMMTPTLVLERGPAAARDRQRGLRAAGGRDRPGHVADPPRDARRGRDPWRRGCTSRARRSTSRAAGRTREVAALPATLGRQPLGRPQSLLRRRAGGRSARPQRGFEAAGDPRRGGRRDRRRMTTVRRATPHDADALVDLAESVGREEGRWILGTGPWRVGGGRAPLPAHDPALSRRGRVRRRGRRRASSGGSRSHAIRIRRAGTSPTSGSWSPRAIAGRAWGRRSSTRRSAWARESGVRKLELHVFPWNEPALAPLRARSASSARATESGSTSAAASSSTPS